MGINARVIQSVSQVQKIIRYNFAYNLLDMYGPDDPFWKMLIFTDFAQLQMEGLNYGGNPMTIDLKFVYHTKNSHISDGLGSHWLQL